MTKTKQLKPWLNLLAYDFKYKLSLQFTVTDLLIIDIGNKECLRNRPKKQNFLNQAIVVDDMYL